MQKYVRIGIAILLAVCGVSFVAGYVHQSLSNHSFPTSARFAASILAFA